MSKKLNNFTPKSTHYAVDQRGQLKFLTINPELNQTPAEEVLLSQPKRFVKEIGLQLSIEYYKYSF